MVKVISALVKTLKQNGIHISHGDLSSWLMNNDYITEDNMPTRKSQALFLIVMVNGAPVLTDTGKHYFINTFLKSAFQVK